MIHLTDADVGYHYVELPEDTTWIESMAYHATYRKESSYYPVQRPSPDDPQRKVTHIYAIEHATTLRHIAGPVALRDGTTDLIPFGSALSSQGLLLLCITNKNILIGFDLERLETENHHETTETVRPHVEIPGIPTINDVCFDPRDESIVYTVGGQTNIFPLPPFKYNDSAFGVLYRTKLDREGTTYTHKTQRIAKGMTTLAGVKCLHGRVYLSQLYNILEHDIDNPKHPMERVWKGTASDNFTWLADTLEEADLFAGEPSLLLAPVYRTGSEAQVKAFMKFKAGSSTAMVYYRLALTARVKSLPRAQAQQEADYLASISNTYMDESHKEDKAQPVRLVFLKFPDCTSGGSKKPQAFHFQVDLEQTVAEHPPRYVQDEFMPDKVHGFRHHFNGQVVTAMHLQSTSTERAGYIACVNFEQPRILFLKDEVFRRHIGYLSGNDETFGLGEMPQPTDVRYS